MRQGDDPAGRQVYQYGAGRGYAARGYHFHDGGKKDQLCEKEEGQVQNFRERDTARGEPVLWKESKKCQFFSEKGGDIGICGTDRRGKDGDSESGLRGGCAGRRSGVCQRGKGFHPFALRCGAVRDQLSF